MLDDKRQYNLKSTLVIRVRSVTHDILTSLPFRYYHIAHTDELSVVYN